MQEYLNSHNFFSTEESEEIGCPIIDYDVDYTGNDLTSATQQLDATTCQAYCLSIDAPYFGFASWLTQGCFCKSSNGGYQALSGMVSGRTSCNGVEYSNTLNDWLTILFISVSQMFNSYCVKMLLEAIGR